MATIPANNNTGLYNTTGVPATTGNDITVSGNVNANNINAVNTVNAGTSITAGTNITAGGNVTADYFIGDGSLLTNINAGNIVGSYGNANVAAYLASGSNSSNIVTTGNVSGTYILGNGSQLTGLPATYGNANVNAHLAAFGSNTIVTTGNITGGYFIGNGSQLTGLPASYGNANVAAFLPTYTGNLAGGNATITTDLTVGGTIYGTFAGNITGNLVVPGANTEVIYNNNGNAGASADFTFNNTTKVLDVNGNIDATTFIGSGSGLTSIPGANVTGTVPLATAATTAGTVTTAAQPNITSVGTLTSLTTSGNVDVGGSLNTDDVTSTGNVTIYGNQVITGNLTVQGTTTTINSNTITTNDKTITVANNQSTGANVNGAGLEAGNPAVATFLYDDATTTWKSSIGLAAVGNITGSYILGNGSQLTGLPATYSNAQVAAYLASGTNTSNIITTGNISGSYILGNGSQLTGLPASYGNANVAAYLPVYSGNIGDTASDLKLTGNSIGLYGLNGFPAINLTNSGLDTFITTNGATRVSLPGANFQVDTVSVEFTYDTTITDHGLAVNGNLFGTGNSITTTGNIATLGIKTDGYYYANGTPISFGGTYGDSNVTTLLGSLGANAINSTANITTTANISGAYILGNGSQLTGLPATYSNADVNAHLAAFGSNVLTTTGNITGGNIIGTNLLLTGNISNPTPGIGGLFVNVADGLTVNASAGSWAGNIVQADTGGSGLTVRSNNEVLAIRNNSDTTILSVVQTGANVTGYLGVSGNVTGGNLVTAGQVVAGGNISGNYILGNGSALTGIVATANLAGNLSGDLNGGNTYSLLFMNNLALSGAISNPAGDFVTIEGIQSSGAISAAGNITGGNLIANGNVSGTYFIGNGSALTGITSSLSGNLTGNINTGSYYITSPGAEVLMGNVWITGTLAANTISSPAGDYVTMEGVNATNGFVTTGNVTTGNLLISGRVYDTSGVFQVDAVGNITLVPTGSTVMYGNAEVTGNVNAVGNVQGSILKSTYQSGSEGGEIQLSLPAGGTTLSGGVTIDVYQDKFRIFETGGTNRGAYIDLSAAAATVGTNLLAGGGGSPGGSDTQIQFNDGGSFAGNAAMTFSKTSGNIGLGNLIVNTQQIQTTANSNVALSSSITPNPGRVVLGSGYNGNISPAYDLNNNLGRSARFLISDSYSFTDGNSVSRGMGVQNYYTLNANVTSTNARINGLTSGVAIGGGSAGNTISGTLTSIIGTAGSVTIGGGTSGNLTGLGNTTVQYASGVVGLPQVAAGSTGGNLFGVLGFINNLGTANTAIGFGINLGGGGTYGGNAYGVYMAGATNNHGYTNNNTARNASNYYFLKNEDNHAYNQVGQLSLYQETMDETLASSGGAVTVDKTNGQVQYYTVSEDATMSFSNFVVSSTVSSTTRYMTDTVTVIVQQDSTGRTITMPSGSAYKYAAGGNVVPSTADSVSMISITAYYDPVAAATAYLVSISPEFS